MACEGAPRLSLDTPVRGSTAGETVMGRGCVSSSAPARWYSWTATQTGSVMIATDSEATDFDTYIALW